MAINNIEERVIKYRGLRLKEETGGRNAWVYGYYVKRGMYIEKPQPHIFDFNNGYAGYRVQPGTVCQYLGVHDCKKQEIYEHDIVTVHDKEWVKEFGKYHLIKWDSAEIDDDFGTSFIGFCNLPYFGGALRTKNKIEIVGNMFDTPELLSEITL